MKEKIETDFFITGDLYLSAGISLLLDIEPIYTIRDGKIFFCFPISDTLYKVMNAFNGGAEGNLFAYALKIKNLKAEIAFRKKLRGTDKNANGK